MTKLAQLQIALSPLALGACATVSSESIGDTWSYPSVAETTLTFQEPPLLQPGQCPDSSDPCLPATPAAAPPAIRADRLGSVAARAGMGIAYFLPRQLVRVTAKRSNKTLADALGDVGKKQAAMATASAGLAAAEADLVQINQALARNPDDVRIRDLLLEERKAIVDRRLKAETAVADAKKAHEAAIETVTAMKVGAPGNDVTLLLEVLPPSADPNFGFRLNPKHSILRDDEHKIEVTSAGLLTSTDITATDRTGDILVELAGIAGALYGGGGRSLAPGCAAPPELVVSVVDLARPDDVQRLGQDLLCMGLKVTVVGTPGEQVKPMQTRVTGPAVFYRTPIEVPVRIEQCSSDCGLANQWVLREVRYVPLPQAGPISMLAQNAGVMTKTRYQLAFKDGMLVKYDANRPSEMIRIAETPMRMLGSVFEGVSKVVSLRTGYNENLSKLSASDLALIQALERDRATQESFEKCAAEKRAAGESVLGCLPAAQ